jgi:hypothetical protein
MIPAGFELSLRSPVAGRRGPARLINVVLVGERRFMIRSMARRQFLPETQIIT